MDLIPTPTQLVAAAGNLAHSVLYGGVADLRTMPRTLLDEGNRRELYHYRPAPGVPSTGDPVLLVTPLAAPSLCFDLRRGCSLVEHLVQQGRPTYLVEYGEVSFADRNLGMEHWIREVLPEAIRATSAHAGGRPVHLVGWSLGGIFSLLTAADDPALPIRSIAAVGTPFDVRMVPVVAPLRPLLSLTDGKGAITRAYQAFGGVPVPVVKWAFQLSSVQKLITKPIVKATNLDDAEFLAQLEAVERFTAQMKAYPGRTFGQLYHRFIKANELRDGTFALADQRVSVGDITAPVLVFAGATDGIAPVKSVEALVPLLTGSAEARFEIVPGGHLGMLTGRAARRTTWRALDEWLTQWASPDLPAPAKAAPTRKAAGTRARKAPAQAAPAKKSAARKTVAKKAPTQGAVAKKATTKKTAAKKAPTKRAVAKKTASQRSAPPTGIGTNRVRRYGSAGSRSLSG